MKNYVITIIGDNKDVINMFNYIFYRGLTIANYTEYIMYNNAIPKFIENRVIDYNELKKRLFREFFAIDDYVSDDDWYDFQKHKVITSKEIVLEKERIYDNQLFNLKDINKKLGFPINNPIIRISELQKVYERSINDLYGNIFLYNLIKQANDISISKNVCIIKGIDDYESVMQIKHTFPLRGKLIYLGKANYKVDYVINDDLLLSKNKFNLFYKIQTIIKFILL